MSIETVGITVTYKEPITFHLRLIGITEENALRQKLFGLTEEQKAEKQYQLNVDMLADLSNDQPTVRRLVTEEVEGKQVESVKEIPLTDKKFPAEMVRDYFSERTVLKERIASYAVNGYFVQLQPDVSFL